jgi:hypothetical protein
MTAPSSINRNPTGDRNHILLAADWNFVDVLLLTVHNRFRILEWTREIE